MNPEKAKRELGPITFGFYPCPDVVVEVCDEQLSREGGLMANKEFVTMKGFTRRFSERISNKSQGRSRHTFFKMKVGFCRDESTMVFHNSQGGREKKISHWPTGERYGNPFRLGSKGRMVSCRLVLVSPTSDVHEISGLLRERLRPIKLLFPDGISCVKQKLLRFGFYLVAKLFPIPL